MYQPSLFPHSEHDPAPEDFFQCTDLGLAGALETLDFAIAQMRRVESNKVEFWFSSSADLHAAIKAYWDGALVVSARAFNETMRSLKTRLHNLK